MDSKRIEIGNLQLITLIIMDYADAGWMIAMPYGHDTSWPKVINKMV